MLDPVPIHEPEILIRYGRFTPHARDRVLDQFYLTYHRGSSLGMYLTAKTATLIAAFLSLTIPLIFICTVITHLLNMNEAAAMSFMYIAVALVELTFFATIFARRTKTRYKELPFQATELGLTATRIYVHSRYIHGGYVKAAMRWEDITSVRLSERHVHQFLNTYIELADTKGRKIELQLDCIQTIEERQILRDCLLQFVTNADVGAAAASLLQAGKQDDVPFTRLWSQALQDSRPRRNTESLDAGATLQNSTFIIKERIGSGGQGAVYLAVTRSIDGISEVVLKEYVLPDLEHEQEHKAAVEQFEKEVRLLGKIENPGVIKLFNAFVEDHRAYLVLEHCHGMSLKDFVEKAGAFSQRQVVAMGQQLCEVLHGLHSMSPSIMHLDFSPENILFNPETGKLTAIDFNVSVEENSIRTRTVMGKQRYMAPEQYRGKPTTCSDVYSLGATLLYLLTGAEPDPISVAKLQKKLPGADVQLAEVLAKATALEEENRYPSARALKEALANLVHLTHCDESSTNSSGNQRSHRQSGNNDNNNALALGSASDDGNS